MTDADVIILGAGAAGMFCAAEAAKRGRRVLVLDHNAAPGEKIRISGGGRCNFTNLYCAPDRFLSANPRFAISALSRFTQMDFVALVDAAGIAWHEKGRGELFCDSSAKAIIDMLVGAMTGAGAELRLGTAVQAVRHNAGGFLVETGTGDLHAQAVVVATGGKSIPKMGASGIGYRIAEGFGLPVSETRAGLVPLTFADPELSRLKAMSGVSLPARVAAGKGAFDGPLLFTHRGLSGPSILQISSYWREGGAINVDLLPGQDVTAALRQMRGVSGKLAPRNALARLLPEKVADMIVQDCGVSGTLGDQPNATLDRIADHVHRWQPRPVGTEGYRTAEVTLGGIATDALEARTMRAKSIPGLYFVGEVVDVTGWLGGYNFQWAWSSGWAAGQVC